MFVNLKTWSHYTILNSLIKIDDIIDFSLKTNNEYVCLSDFEVMYGAMELYTKAIKNKLKPIIGLNFIHNNNEYNLICKNYHGYLQLIKLSSFISQKKSIEEILKLINNDIFVISSDYLIAKNIFINCDNIYTTQFNHEKEIANHNALYFKKEDAQYFKYLKAIKENIDISVLKETESIDNYLLNQKEASEIYSKKALDNLNLIVSEINLVIPLNTQTHFIKFDKNIASDILLENKCLEGIKKRLNTSHVPKKYAERLLLELNVIHKMNFDDYFLVVQDYVNYAKNNNILVGPGRGSAAGSLVSFVLGITNVDPIKHNLIFERFLNYERASMPDIDVDFVDYRRPEIFDYILNKYGKNNCAKIITFQKIKARTALKDAGRILGMSHSVLNLITKNVSIKYEEDIQKAISHSKTLKEYSLKYEQLFSIAEKLIGLTRQIGLHAAGIVLCDKEMWDVIPIIKTNTEYLCTQYSMEYLEANGIIKNDILGLSNLSIIEQNIELIKKTKQKNISIDEINYEDSRVFADLSNGKTTGIFQLESPGMTDLILKIKPRSIEDISIVSALFRPGPQQSKEKYLANRKNKTCKAIDDSLNEILDSTYGVIIYQEQVIRIVQKVANYSLAKADTFRRVISKKKFEEMQKLKIDFIQSSISNGYAKETSEKIFSYVEEFANYGFNHSHSLAYSYISYQLAYLKTYYPLEFYTTLLKHNAGSEEKINFYCNEARNLGIAIYQPDIFNSCESFSIINDGIIFGFDSIKTIGSKTAEKIIDVIKPLRKNKDIDFTILISHLLKAGVGEKNIETLFISGCFDNLMKNIENNQYQYWKNLQNIFKNANNYSNTLGFLVQIPFQIFEFNEQENEKLKKDKVFLIGFDFKAPIDLSVFKSKIKTENIKENNIPKALKSIESGGVSLPFVVAINSIKTIITRNNSKMSFIRISDEYALLDIVSFLPINEDLNIQQNSVYEITIKRTKSNYLVIDKIISELKNE